MKLQEAQELVEREELDAFLFSSQPSVFYLSGFRSTHAYVVLGKDFKALLTDGRYFEKAKAQLPDWEVVLIKGQPSRFLKRFLREKGFKKVGFESDRVSCEMRKSLRSTAIKWVPKAGFLNELRAVKTREELGILKEAVKKTDAIYRDLLKKIKTGMREFEVRRLIVNGIFEQGASGESFPAIVASGDGSAIPHWETSDREIRGNEPLLIDMGLVWRGYCSDFTRTLFLGKADEEFKKVYTVVRDAHLFALEEVKVGNEIGNVDRRAREHIKKKGFGKFFTHSTGHGVGVEIHEFPRVYYKGKDAKRVIEEGMVFTIEPGIYLPGKFGVRLENIVAVVDGRGEPLSEVSLDLVEL